MFICHLYIFFQWNFCPCLPSNYSQTVSSLLLTFESFYIFYILVFCQRCGSPTLELAIHSFHLGFCIAMLFIVLRASLQAYLILLCFALLHFTDIMCFLQIEGFYKLLVCVKQVYQHHFSNSICSLCVTVIHFGISRIFQIFYYYDICYGDLWSVIFDVTIVIVLGSHAMPIKDSELNR